MEIKADRTKMRYFYSADKYSPVDGVSFVLFIN